MRVPAVYTNNSNGRICTDSTWSILQVLISAGQNPEILQAQQGVSKATVKNAELVRAISIWSAASAVVHNFKVLRVLPVSAATNPKYCESTKYLAQARNIGSNCEKLRYERTPHVIAPKLRRLVQEHTTCIVPSYMYKYEVGQRKEVDLLVQNKSEVQEKKKRRSCESNLGHENTIKRTLSSSTLQTYSCN